MRKYLFLSIILAFSCNSFALTNQQILNFYKQEAEQRALSAKKILIDIDRINQATADLMMTVISSQQDEINRYQSIINIHIDALKQPKTKKTEVKK